MNMRFLLAVLLGAFLSVSAAAQTVGVIVGRTPVNGGTVGQCLTVGAGGLMQTTSGCGVTGNLTVGTSTIAGGTASGILTNNAGVLAAGPATIDANGNVWISNRLSIGADPYISTVTMEVRGIDNSGRSELRLAARTPDTANDFIATYWFNNFGFIEIQKSSGPATLDVSPKSFDATSDQVITLFHNSILTSGNNRFRIYGGTSINTELTGATNSYINALGGRLGVGLSSPLAAFHVEGAAGELARFTNTGASSFGLSLGYTGAGSTTAYLYNRYAASAASAIAFGFGTSYGSSVALTLTEDLNAAFGKNVTVASGSLAVGLSTASATLHVEGIAGELARFTNTGASSFGLSFGYTGAGSTTAYIYNRFSSATAAAIDFGFGTSFGSSVALALTKDLNAAFGGAVSIPAGSLAVGLSTASAALHVEGIAGELARFTNTGASSFGLSLGYTGAGSTTAYVYNRNASATAAAIAFGFGTTFGSTVALSLTKDLNVTLGANMTLVPMIAPASPGTAGAWTLYVDGTDSNKLKAKASTGTIVTLGTP